MTTNYQENLQRIGITQLNAMQNASLEAFGQNSELVLLSPTGSGKTLAFLLPMLDTFNPDVHHVQAVVVAPARELALQIEEVFRSLKTGFGVVCCYGGHPFDAEQKSLASNPALIVATPGRLNEHLREHTFAPEMVRSLVLDEFDKSLELGFTDEMEKLIGCFHDLSHKVLTSATEAIEIPEYVGLKNPRKLNYLKGAATSRLTLYEVVSPKKDKLETLKQLLCTLGDQQSIIFCNYRESADRILDYLDREMSGCAAFHGGQDQPLREKVLCMFRNGSVRVLVSTDLAARGLDIPTVGNIIHYHLPGTAEAFTHRNGRTARQTATGNAYVILAQEEERPDYLPQNMPIMRVEEGAPVPPPPAWTTLYIGKGKNDKISKGDILGFLCKQGGLQSSDLGLIEVKLKYALCTVKAELMPTLLKTIRGLKIKGQKTLFQEAHLDLHYDKK